MGARVSDALLRIEYKQDLIIAALQHAGLMLPTEHIPPMKEMGSLGDSCPCCGQPIKLTPDYANECVSRACGCAPSVHVVRGISSLTKPPEAQNGQSSKSPLNQVPPDEAP